MHGGGVWVGFVGWRWRRTSHVISTVNFIHRKLLLPLRIIAYDYHRVVGKFLGWRWQLLRALVIVC